MPWTNGHVFLFHGTNTAALGLHTAPQRGTTLAFRPQAAHGRRLYDFGLGFYTTTWEHQAEQWANDSLRKRRAAAPTFGPQIGGYALVLRFQVNWEDLASVAALSFSRDSGDFYDLVAHCRSGRRGHRRATPRPPHYAVVSGPVSMGQQRLVIHGADQISFHDQMFINSHLQNPTVSNVATRPDGLF